MDEPGRRIVVIGTTGSGKTMLGDRLSQILGIPHVELDALHWGPDWSEAPLDEFRRKVGEALRDEAWVIDGNYSKVRDLMWRRADTIVWLDYPLPLVMYRLLRRTFQRVFMGIELWAGNRERLGEQFFSRQSLLLWALQTHGKHRRTYPQILQEPEHRHLRLIRLHSPHQTEQWLANLPEASPRP